MAKELTEEQLAALSDEQRMEYLTSDEDSAEPGDDSLESDDETPEDDEGAGEGLQERIEDDEQDDDSEEDGEPAVYRGPGKPEVAVSKERNRRKKAEREAAQKDGQIAELSGQVQSLTNLVAQMMVNGGMSQAKAEAAAEQIVEDAEEAAPDIEEDPEGWAKHLEKKLMGKIEELTKENQELKQARVIDEQTAALERMQAAFAEQHPDYFEIVNLDDPNNPLTKFYATNPEVYERHMAAKNPVEEAYFEGLAQHAKAAAREGKPFTPKAQAQVKTPSTPKVSKKEVPPSLATVGGTRERVEDDSFGDLTEEEVAALSPKQRARYLQGA